MSDRGTRNALGILLVLMILAWCVIGTVWLCQAGLWWVAVGFIFPCEIALVYWLFVTDKF